MLISLIIDRTHFIRGYKHFIDLSIIMLRLSCWVMLGGEGVGGQICLSGFLLKLRGRGRRAETTLSIRF